MSLTCIIPWCIPWPNIEPGFSCKNKKCFLIIYMCYHMTMPLSILFQINHFMTNYKQTTIFRLMTLLSKIIMLDNSQVLTIINLLLSSNHSLFTTNLTSNVHKCPQTLSNARKCPQTPASARKCPR